MTRRDLVTGGAGFIGGPVTHGLIDAGDDVHVASRSGDSVSGAVSHQVDLLDTAASTALVEALSPSHLVHLAWVTDHGTYWADDANRSWQRASLELFRAFAAGGGRRIVAAGTCAEYDWSTPGPYREDAPTEPATLYGKCKLATFVEAQEQLADTATSLCWARLFHLYGAGEHPDRLVPSLVNAAKAGEIPTPRNPDTVIDLLHVRDAAVALVALCGAALEGVVNVAGGVPRSIGEIAAEIASIHGVAPSVSPAQDRVSRSVVTADVRRMRECLDLQPPISLAAGTTGCTDPVPLFSRGTDR